MLRVSKEAVQVTPRPADGALPYEATPAEAIRLLRLGCYFAVASKTRVKRVLYCEPIRVRIQDARSGMPILPPSVEWIRSRRSGIVTPKLRAEVQELRVA